MTNLVNTTELEEILTGLEIVACEVERDEDAGTVIARDDDVIVLRGIAKGPRGPWIVTFSPSNHVKWR